MSKIKKSLNIFWHRSLVTRKDRERLNGHKATVIWLTGLSGSGKSTIAHLVEERLYQLRCRSIVLDGDNVRHGLCGDLGFSKIDRSENIRRIGELSNVLIESGIIVLAAFISPLSMHRKLIRDIIGDVNFIEVFCDCPIDICESRDVKGLYKKARQGLVTDFTGVSAPYEKPEAPDIVLQTGVESLDMCVDNIISLLEFRNIIYSTEK